MEIALEQFDKLNKDEYSLLDMRSESDRAYGIIPGAEPIDPDDLENGVIRAKNGKIVIYCAHGVVSAKAAENLRNRGYEAYSLKGGYLDWLRREMQKDTGADFCEKAEQSIRKKFRVELMSKFIKAVKQYKLLSEGDRVAVCISGGKDSMLMAKLFQELHRYSEFDFGLEFLVMDPGYNADNRMAIEKNARRLNVPVKIFETNIFDAVYNVEKSPCYLCARMRRGYLYNFARQLGCNKIALGHHYDDVIETVLMGMLYGAQIQTMMPKLHSTNFKGMQLIRPMYLIREDDIKAWRDYNDLHFIQCACKFTDNCSSCDDGVERSKRRQIKNLIRTLKKTHPDVEKCIFRSVENVNLETVIAYKVKGEKHSFLDDYDEK